MSAPRPFRFGVVAAHAGSAEQWSSKARRAEALDYATLVVPDGLNHSLAPQPNARRSPARRPAPRSSG
jgi:hypothetical protein